MGADQILQLVSIGGAPLILWSLVDHLRRAVAKLYRPLAPSVEDSKRSVWPLIRDAGGVGIAFMLSAGGMLEAAGDLGAAMEGNPWALVLLGFAISYAAGVVQDNGPEFLTGAS